MQFTDQLGHTITLNTLPRRIVSIVPSQSEYLWDLGLHNELVGVTKFCIHPPGLRRSAANIGGTKKLLIQKILDLKPDLVIGNKEENDILQIEQLKTKVPVWMSDIVSIDDAVQMMEQLGIMVGKEKEASKLVGQIRAALETVRGVFNGQRVAYFIWSRPYMFAGSNTFIDSVLNHMGLVNAVGSLVRYPVLEIEDLQNAHPDYCFLSSEPYPFNDSHAKTIGSLLTDSKVLVVDGEIFSWYGSRLIKMPDYIRALKARL
jgi:ABC-type Fe3+-hydroxamate transport system substrate-binding protein